jgi:hypothetical protein
VRVPKLVNVAFELTVKVSDASMAPEPEFVRWPETVPADTDRVPVTLSMPAPEIVPPSSVSVPLDVELLFVKESVPEICRPPLSTTVSIDTEVESSTGRFGLPVGIHATLFSLGIPWLQLVAVFHAELVSPVHESVHAGELKVNSSPLTAALSFSASNTRMSTVPAGPPGELTRIFVEDLNLMPAAKTTPNSTFEVLVKFVPRIVTTVDPVLGPELGEIFVTVGVGVVF